MNPMTTTETALTHDEARAQAADIMAHPCARDLAVIADRAVGFDIETDTSPLTEEEKATWGDVKRGLDPQFSRVTAVSFHQPGRPERVFDADDELDVLVGVHLYVGSLGDDVVLAGWNSAGFDVPFLRQRYAHHFPGDAPFAVSPIPGDQPKYPPTPGLGGAVEGAWLGHGLVDIYRVLRPAFAEYPALTASLKPFATALGLDVIEVDRTAMHELSREERYAYVASDTRLVSQIIAAAT